MFQTRDYEGDIREYQTLKEAMDYANSPLTSVWKVSFDAFNGDRVRLVLAENGHQWIFEDLIEAVEEILNQDC